MLTSHVFHHVFPAMHTRYSVVLPGVDCMTGERLVRDVETLGRTAAVVPQPETLARLFPMRLTISTTAQSPARETNSGLGTGDLPRFIVKT